MHLGDLITEADRGCSDPINLRKCSAAAGVPRCLQEMQRSRQPVTVLLATTGPSWPHHIAANLQEAGEGLVQEEYTAHALAADDATTGT